VRRKSSLFLILLIGNLQLNSAAQNPASNSPQVPPFRVESDIVQVPVTVTSKRGIDVADLQASDFEVLVDGVQRQITLDRFDTGVAPISLVVAIQSAGISTPAIAKIRRIGGMIQPLVIGSRGEAAVLAFDSEVKWLQDFTADSGAISNAVTNVKPGESMQACMFDAVLEAANRMKQRKGRKILLLISETRDRGSKTRFDEALDAVEREGVQVFAAHYSAYATTWIAKPEDVPPADSNLIRIFTEAGRLARVNAVQTLTTATGGSDFPFAKERTLENSIQKLGAEIHSQYILSFPQRSDSAHRPGLHRIEVLVPDRDDLRIRFRQSYRVD
jgi:VWFA-related protein